MREALDALDLLVVIDVALTETARQADYVLPAASQFEKWECTFFNLEFPRNFPPPPPVLEPLAGTLPEYEIHARLCRALGAYTDDDLAPLHEAAAARAAPRTPRRSSARHGAPRAARLAAGAPLRDARPDAAAARWRSRRRRGRALGLAQTLRAGVPGVDPPRRLR